MVNISSEKVYNSYLIETYNYDAVKKVIKKLAIDLGFDEKLVETENHIDIKYIEEKYANISIDVLRREVLDDYYLTPSIANRKFYIIYDAVNLSEIAENTMLKSLEEPPEYVSFFLVTSNINKLLDTIKSRCFIIKDNDKINYEELYSFECIDDTLKLLGNIKYENVYDIMTFADNFSKNNEYYITLIKLLRCVLRDALIYKKTLSKKNIILKEKCEAIISISNSLSYSLLGKLVEDLNFMSKIKNLNVDKKIAVYNFFSGRINGKLFRN